MTQACCYQPVGQSFLDTVLLMCQFDVFLLLLPSLHSWYWQIKVKIVKQVSSLRVVCIPIFVSFIGLVISDDVHSSHLWFCISELLFKTVRNTVKLLVFELFSVTF